MVDERFFDETRQRYFYGREEWRSYLEAERENQQGLHLPDPDEILIEMANIRWLREQKFPDSFVRAVIHHRSPRIDLVRRLTRKHGARGAYRILKDFMT